MSHASEGPPPSAPARRAGLSIVGILSAVTILELLLYRILLPVLRSELELAPRAVRQTFAFTASFLLNLETTLALLALAVALPLWLVRGGLSGPGRIIAAPLLLLFLPLAVLLTTGPELVARALPGVSRMQAYLYMLASFFTLAALLVVSVSARRIAPPRRLGALLLLVPLGLRVLCYFGIARGQDEQPLLALSDGAALAALALVPLCFRLSAAGRPRRALALSNALGVGVGLGLLVRADWETAQRVLFHSLGLHLPTTRPLQAMLLLCLSGFVYGVTDLLQRGGDMTRIGAGLLLYGMAGFQLQEGSQLAVCLCGLLCLSRANQT